MRNHTSNNDRISQWEAWSNVKFYFYIVRLWGIHAGWPLGRQERPAQKSPAGESHGLEHGGRGDQSKRELRDRSISTGSLRVAVRHFWRGMKLFITNFKCRLKWRVTRFCYYPQMVHDSFVIMGSSKWVRWFPLFLSQHKGLDTISPVWV